MKVSIALEGSEVKRAIALWLIQYHPALVKDGIEKIEFYWNQEGELGHKLQAIAYPKIEPVDTSTGPYR